MSKISKIDEIAQKITEQIMKGKYVSGQRLPSERELSEEFGTSRPTIRETLQRLQTDNLIDIIPRSGAFVRSPSSKITVGSISNQELKHAGSFIRTVEAQGREALVRFIEPSSIIPAGNKLAEKMKIDPHIEVLRRYRVHLVDRTPYRILDSYYLAELTRELLGKDEGYIPLFKWLRENKNIRAARVYEELNIRMPSQKEAQLLNISRGQPVVEMDRWVWSETDLLFEYSRIIANASLHKYTYSYDLTEEASR